MVLLRKMCAGLALFLPLAGCRDPAGPCDPRYACEVHGVDLYIPQLEIVATRFDSIDGLGIIEPDPALVDFTVRNRGDTLSAPVTLVLDYSPAFPDSLQIPSLRPGQSHSRRDTITTREVGFRYRGDDDSSWVRAELLINDADTTNNRAESRKVHVAVGILEVSLTMPGDVRVNVPFDAQLVVRNLSGRASLPPLAIGFRLYTPVDLGGHAAGQEAFSTHDIPALPPGGRYVRESLMVTPRASHQNSVMELVVWSMIARAGASDLSIGSWVDVLYHVKGPGVTVHPDYRACRPALLQPDTVVWAPIVCDVPYRFALFELQARPDQIYRIDHSDPRHPSAWLCTDDGERISGWGVEERQFPEGGTFWVEDGPRSHLETGPRPMLLRARPLPGAARAGGAP